MSARLHRCRINCNAVAAHCIRGPGDLFRGVLPCTIPGREYTLDELKAAGGPTKGYAEEKLAEAIELLWDELKTLAGERALDGLISGNPIIEEINAFGPRGPVGLGLGRYGGHAPGG